MSSSTCSFSVHEHKIALPVSPFQHLLHTDHVAQRSQFSLIQQAIAAAQTVLADLRNKRQLLHDAIKAMDIQEMNLDADIRAHQAMLMQSTLHRVPLEVLGHIFMHAINETEFHFGLYAQNNIWTLLRLSHVCRRWRMAAVQRSDLWSRVNVVVGDGWRRPSHHKLFALSMERSRTHSLIVSIGTKRRSVHSVGYAPGGEYEAGSDPESVLPLSLLKGHSTRITSLEIATENAPNYWNILEESEIRFPSLVSLRILDPESYYTVWHYPGVVTMFSESTLLNELFLGKSIADTRILLPVDNLAHFETLAPSISYRHRILKAAPNLHTLHWTYSNKHSVGELLGPDLETLDLSSVRRFIVNCFFHDEMQDAVNQVRFSQLEEISGLDLDTFCTSFGPAHVKPLETVSLRFPAYVADQYVGEGFFLDRVKEFLDILAFGASDLKNFTLSWDERHWDGDDDEEFDLHIYHGLVVVINTFLQPDREEFANLETLSLNYVPLRALSEALLRGVRLRLYPKTLKHISLVYFKDTPAEQLSRFRRAMELACCDVGLTVTIQTGNLVAPHPKGCWY